MNISIPSLPEFIISLVLYGGGSAAVAYAIFHFFGKKLVESWFEKNRADYTHKQQLELQRLSLEIDSRLNGVLKLQEMEFRILPEVWQKLHETYQSIVALVALFKLNVNVTSLSESALDEFLSANSFTAAEIDYIKNSQDKDKALQAIHFKKKVGKAENSIREIKDLAASYSIFIPEDIKSEFDAIVQELWSALVDKDVGYEYNDFSLQKAAWHTLNNKIEPIYLSIGQKIRARLRVHGSKDNI